MLELFKIKPKSVQIDAVITRADGTKENVGTIVYYNSNPILNLYWKVKTLFHKVFSNIKSKFK